MYITYICDGGRNQKKVFRKFVMHIHLGELFFNEHVQIFIFCLIFFYFVLQVSRSH